MKRTRLVLLAILVAALALRLAHLWAVWPVLGEDGAEVGMDRWLAMHVAQAVARGDWLGGWSAEYDSAPGYAYVLAGLLRLAEGDWLVPLLLQCVLGVLACVLVFSIGRRLHSTTVGLLAAGLLAGYAPAIFYETLLVKFSLVTVTMAALLYGVFEAGAQGRLRPALLAGLALGLLVALRGNAIVLAVPCAWWLARAAPRPPGWRGVALLLAGAALVLGPLAVRDHVAASRGRATSLWGIHFYIGAQREADGTYAPVSGVRGDVVGHIVDARTLAERAEGRPLRADEVSWYWFHRGVAEIRADPGRYLRLQLGKLRLALAGNEDGSFGDDFDDAVGASWVLRLPLVTFGSIAPLALLGAVLVLRSDGRLLVTLVATYVLSLLPFFVTGRYRLPLVVPMLLLAAVALDALAARVRAGRARDLLRPALFLAGSLSVLAAGARDRWTFLAVLILGVQAVTLLDDGGASSLDEVAERAQPIEPLVGNAWPGIEGPMELPQPRPGVSQ